MCSRLTSSTVLGMLWDATLSLSFNNQLNTQRSGLKGPLFFVLSDNKSYLYYIIAL